MRLVASLIIALLGCMGLSAQAPAEYFNVGNPIEYCGTEFYLAWGSHPIEDYYIQEYLPQGESFEHYTRMFSVSVLFWDKTPLEAIEAKIAELNLRKKDDPVINYVAAENNGEYILEFIVSDSDGDKLNFVELDVHHYTQMTFNGRNATVLGFYSCRAYGDDIIPFIQSIPEKRSAWYEGMIKLQLMPRFPEK